MVKNQLPYPILKYLEFTPEKLDALMAEYPFYQLPRVAKILDLNKMAGLDLSQLNYFGFNEDKLQQYAKSYDQIEILPEVNQNITLSEQDTTSFTDIAIDITEGNTNEKNLIAEIPLEVEIDSEDKLVVNTTQDEVVDDKSWLEELIKLGNDSFGEIDLSENNAINTDIDDETFIEEELHESLDIEFLNKTDEQLKNDEELSTEQIINEEISTTEDMVEPEVEQINQPSSDIDFVEDNVLPIQSQQALEIDLATDTKDVDTELTSVIDFEFIEDINEGDNFVETPLLEKIEAKLEQGEIQPSPIEFSKDETESVTAEDILDSSLSDSKEDETRDFNAWLLALSSQTVPPSPIIKSVQPSEVDERIEKNLLDSYSNLSIDAIKPNQLNTDEELDNVLNDQFFKSQVEHKKISRKTPAELRLQDEAQQSLQPINIVSETMAILYVQQGNISRAIEVYEKLITLFPEKSSFFAVQIEKLKK